MSFVSLIPLITSLKTLQKRLQALRLDCNKSENRCRTATLEASYKAYVFINTGQENGKSKTAKTGKKKPLTTVKSLELVIGMGTLKAVKAKDRSSI